MLRLPGSIDIREVGMRDGLQLEEPIPLDAKLRMLEAIMAIGVRRVEVTSFVSAADSHNLANAGRTLEESVPQRRTVHFHDTRGTGQANALASILAGVTQLDAVFAAAAVTERAVGHQLPSSLYRAGGRSVPRGPFSSGS